MHALNSVAVERKRSADIRNQPAISKSRYYSVSQVVTVTAKSKRLSGHDDFPDMRGRWILCRHLQRETVVAVYGVFVRAHTRPHPLLFSLRDAHKVRIRKRAHAFTLAQTHICP
jgi:hypothetical protein